MRYFDMTTYLKGLKSRYLKGNRATKKLILDELCHLKNCHRKHAIRLMTRTAIGYRDKPSGRKKIYNSVNLSEALKHLWLASDQMCGARLKAAIPLWLPHFEMNPPLSNEDKLKLLTMSERTINRLLKPFRARYPKRLGGTKPGSLLKNQIAIKTDQWDESSPGFVEGDTVAHCGTNLLGNFVWSLTLTDIYSGWTENRAVWNKGAHGVLKQIESIEVALPFELLGFDSDNGSEFLNWHLLRYFQKREKSPQFTRSRPYHKGDNAHVEQKNWTHVRQIFGYERFSNPMLVDLMNDLYKNELSLLHNYFYPAMKIQNKCRDGAKLKKYYDKPQTPYQRLLRSDKISNQKKEELKNIFQTLNPFELRKNIQKKLKIIFQFVGVNLKKKTGSD